MTGGWPHSSQAGRDRGRLNYEENREAVNIYGYQLIFGKTDTQAQALICLLGSRKKVEDFSQLAIITRGSEPRNVVHYNWIESWGEPGSRGGVAKNEQNESLPSRLQNTRHNFPRSQWPGITITWPGNLKLPPTARHLAHSGHRDLLSKGPRVNPWPLIG